LRGLVLALCASLLALLVIAGIVAIQSLIRMHDQETAFRHVLTERTQMLVSLWASVDNYRQAVDHLAKAPARPGSAHAAAPRSAGATNRFGIAALPQSKRL
jgi:hypothetical protein